MMQSGLAPTLLSVAVIAVFLLGAGGLWLISKRRDAKKGGLMLAASLVLLGNVVISTL